MCRIRDPERFSKIAAGVQSFVVAAAVLVGGGWTLYTFNSQLQVENAKAQLDKMTRELEREPKIEVAITVVQIPSELKGSIEVVGDVTFRNVGNETTAINFPQQPIRLYKVSFDDHGRESWQEVRAIHPRADDSAMLAGTVVHAGATISIKFATTVPSVGIYATTFAAPRNNAEVEKARSSGAIIPSRPLAIDWSGRAYFRAR